MVAIACVIKTQYMARADKWLLRKTSGSKREHLSNGAYADDRNKKNRHGDELPHNEGFKQSWHTMDTGLVKRWLYSKVGEDFDTVYSEFVSRIQPKFQAEYLECIYWYVNARNDTRMDAQGYAHQMQPNYYGDTMLPSTQQVSFYVHPDTNQLVAITDTQKQLVKTVWEAHRKERRLQIPKD